jgi:hypothetical protein
VTDSRKRAPSQAFKRRQRAYVVKVREDKKYPAHAKLMCFVISEHWNEESGEAVISTHTIAKEAGISQTNVCNMLEHPRIGDHLRFEIVGKNRSNRYWPIEQTGAQSEDGKTEHRSVQFDAPEKPKSNGATEQFHGTTEHFSPETEQTGVPNLFNLQENHSPSTDRPVSVEREVTTTARVERRKGLDFLEVKNAPASGAPPATAITPVETGRNLPTSIADEDARRDALMDKLADRLVAKLAKAGHTKVQRAPQIAIPKVPVPGAPSYEIRAYRLSRRFIPPQEAADLYRAEQEASEREHEQILKSEEEYFSKDENRIPFEVCEILNLERMDHFDKAEAAALFALRNGMEERDIIRLARTAAYKPLDDRADAFHTAVTNISMPPPPVYNGTSITIGSSM